MSKNALISIIIFVLLIATGAFFILSDNSGENTQLPGNMNLNPPLPSNDSGVSQVTRPANGVTPPENLVEMPESALAYNLDENSTASYVVQKRLLSEEDEEVVGTTDNITGGGWIDLESNTMYLSAQVSLLDLDSGEIARDTKITDLFNTQLAKVETNANLQEQVKLDTQFTQIIPINITINDVTQELEFEVTATVSRDTFVASGSLVNPVKMSSFNITPPNLLNVSSVDDEMGLRFDISGTNELANSD